MVSTSKSPPKIEAIVNDPSFVRVELPLAMRTILDALKEIKREIIEEVENVIEKKIRIYDAGLKEQLSETEENVRRQ